MASICEITLDVSEESGLFSVSQRERDDMKEIKKSRRGERKK